MMLMEWEWRWNEKFHCQKQGYSNCSSWQPFVCFLFGKKHHGHCLGLAFRWEPMVIDLVQPSAGNAICVMGFNFLETDHPWFLTVTTSLVGWISGLGEPNPRPASLCGTLLAPPLWVSTLHQFGQVNGGWWAWPVERHGSAILAAPWWASSSRLPSTWPMGAWSKLEAVSGWAWCSLRSKLWGNVEVVS